MTTRSKEIFGVKLVRLEDHRSRVVTRAVNSIWGAFMLCPDGKVAVSQDRVLSVNPSASSGLLVAAALNKLGVIDNEAYSRLKSDHDKYMNAQDKLELVRSFKDHAHELKIELTVEQEAQLGEMK